MCVLEGGEEGHHFIVYFKKIAFYIKIEIHYYPGHWPYQSKSSEEMWFFSISSYKSIIPNCISSAYTNLHAQSSTMPVFLLYLLSASPVPVLFFQWLSVAEENSDNGVLHQANLRLCCAESTHSIHHNPRAATPENHFQSPTLYFFFAHCLSHIYVSFVHSQSLKRVK